MISLHEKFIVDEKGKRIAVMLDIEEYQKILDALEELESILAYNTAKASGDEAIPFDQAISESEQTR